MADLHKWQKGQVLQPKTDAITYSKGPKEILYSSNKYI